MKIKTKYVGFMYISIIILAILTLGFAFYHQMIVSKSVDKILHYENKLELVSQLELSLSKLLMPANDYLIHGNEEEKFIFKEADADVNRLFKTLKANNFSVQLVANEHELISHLKDEYMLVKGLSEKILSLPDPIGNKEGSRIMEEMDLVVDNMLDDMNTFHRNSRLNSLKEIEFIDTYFSRYMIIILSIFAVTGTGSVVYGFFLHKGVVSPILRLAEYMRFVEKGDLSRRLVMTTNDEINYLATSFDTMRVELGKLLRNNEETKRDWDSTFNSVEDVITVYDRNCRLIRFNTALTSSLNIMPKYNAAKKCYDFVHNKDDILFEAPIKAVSSG